MVGRPKFLLGINRLSGVLDDLGSGLEEQLALTEKFQTDGSRDRQIRPIVTSVTPNSGADKGNAVVVLQGTAFGGATQVQFGSTPAVGFTVVDDRTITALIPSADPATATVQVRVMTAVGSSVPNPPGDEFTFTAASAS
jgi:hypothetical protein